MREEEEADDDDQERAPRAPRRRVVDVGVGPAAADDWRNFDIGRVVGVLRTTNEAALRFQLRKLHVRWWRASTMTMQRFLTRVGVSDQALALIKEIVDTCATCSKWVRPGPHNQVDINIPDTFNQQVEMDLLFHGHHVTLFST
jgi:hypothetical protein